MATCSTSIRTPIASRARIRAWVGLVSRLSMTVWWSPGITQPLPPRGSALPPLRAVNGAFRRASASPGRRRLSTARLWSAAVRASTTTAANYSPTSRLRQARCRRTVWRHATVSSGCRGYGSRYQDPGESPRDGGSSYHLNNPSRTRSQPSDPADGAAERTQLHDAKRHCRINTQSWAAAVREILRTIARIPRSTSGAYDKSNVLPYTINYTFNVQWQPRNDLAVTIGYTGNRGRHAVIPIPFNEPQTATPTSPAMILGASPHSSGETSSYGYDVLNGTTTCTGAMTTLLHPVGALVDLRRWQLGLPRPLRRLQSVLRAVQDGRQLRLRRAGNAPGKAHVPRLSGGRELYLGSCSR